MSHTYEVEIKSLLGTADRARDFKTSLKKLFPEMKIVGGGKQINHYFNLPSDIGKLVGVISPLVSEDLLESLEKIVSLGKNISLRTREVNNSVMVVMKASVDKGSSSNAVTRVEFEAIVPMSIDRLDQALVSAGCSYQAKWSREREECIVGQIHICLDKNAGYGYVVEFERVVEDAGLLELARKDIMDFMKVCGLEELPQDRIERMFAYYNAHWQDYYGTDKTFIIE